MQYLDGMLLQLEVRHELASGNVLILATQASDQIRTSFTCTNITLVSCRPNKALHRRLGWLGVWVIEEDSCFAFMLNRSFQSLTNAGRYSTQRSVLGDIQLHDRL